MFGIGMPELIIILVVALIVVGPKKLPDLAKSLGRGMSEFRKATDEIKQEFQDNESYQDLQEIKKSVDSVQDTVRSMNPKQVLDVEPLLSPKKPSENLQGRKELVAEITHDVEEVAEAAEETLEQGPPQAAGAPAPEAPAAGREAERARPGADQDDPPKDA
jgi:sec-independent protein translocase protein TatB